MEKIQKSHPSDIAGFKVLSVEDLSHPTDGLPPTEGLRLWLANGVRIIIRPSGTEAKIKCYIEVISNTGRDDAMKTIAQLRAPLIQYLK